MKLIKSRLANAYPLPVPHDGSWSDQAENTPSASEVEETVTSRLGNRFPPPPAPPNPRPLDEAVMNFLSTSELADVASLRPPHETAGHSSPPVSRLAGAAGVREAAAAQETAMRQAMAREAAVREATAHEAAAFRDAKAANEHAATEDEVLEDAMRMAEEAAAKDTSKRWRAPQAHELPRSTKKQPVQPPEDIGLGQHSPQQRWRAPLAQQLRQHQNADDDGESACEATEAAAARDASAVKWHVAREAEVLDDGMRKAKEATAKKPCKKWRAPQAHELPHNQPFPPPENIGLGQRFPHQRWRAPLAQQLWHHQNADDEGQGDYYDEEEEEDYNEEDEEEEEVAEEEYHDYDAVGDQSTNTRTEDKQLYSLLEIASNASAEDIRKAYKRSCVKNHPDKGGDRAKFDDISRAYQILSDPKLRDMYDALGMQGVEMGEAAKKDLAKTDPSDDEAHPLATGNCSIPLELAFTGGVVQAPLMRCIPCPICGIRDSNGVFLLPCQNCEGTGRNMHVDMFRQRACVLCGGNGMVHRPCMKCGGEQVIREYANISVNIPAGVGHNERIVVPEQGHRFPGKKPRDAAIICGVQHHARFIRQGDDLYADHVVPLKVAICGGVIDVVQVDGRYIRARLARGSVLAPGRLKCIPGEGMPKRQNPHLRGDMVLRFVVDFPEAIPEPIASRLERAFRKESDSGACSDDASFDDIYLADFDIASLGKPTPFNAAQSNSDTFQPEASGLFHDIHGFVI